MESLSQYLQKILLNHLLVGSLFILQNESTFYQEMIDIPSDIKKKTLRLLRIESTSYPKELTSILDVGGPSQLTRVELYLYDQLQLSESLHGIGDLKHLIRLNLSRNELTSLPESFGNLTSLQVLNLSRNNLTSLPESFGNLTSLQQLHLRDNKLTSFPESFENLRSLRFLDLTDNNIPYKDLSDLRDTFKFVNHLSL